MTPLFPPGPLSVRPIHWLWRPYLACGKLALLDGDPGAGKSLLAADLGARLTRGGRLPDGTWRRRKANVLFLNAEDGLDDTLRPRLDAARWIGERRRLSPPSGPPA